MYLNEVRLIGDIKSDLVLRKTNKDQSVINFILKTYEKWKNQGKIYSKEKFHKIIAWDRTAELVNERYNKYDKVLIEGVLNYHKKYLNTEFVRFDDDYIFNTEIRIKKIFPIGNQTKRSVFGESNRYSERETGI